MSSETIKEFLVGLGFQVDQAGLQKFNEGINQATVAVTAIGAAAVAGAGLLTSFIKGVADKYDALGDLSDRVNSTAEEIMRLGYVATFTGSSIQAANASIENLSRVAGEAALGIGRGAKIFEDLGLSAKDSNGNLKDTSVLMSEIGAKIQDMGRGEQLAILSKLGIDPTMVQALTTDISALQDEFSALYKNAGVDANKAAEQSGEFNDSMDRLGMTFDAIKSAVGLKFMGQVKNGIDALRKFLVESMPKIINAVTPVIVIVLRIAEAFITIVGRIGGVITKIIGWLADLNTATNGWAGYILAAVAAWKILNLAFLATPIGKLLLLAGALALLIDDFLTFKKNGQALIDWGSGWGIVLQAVTAALAGLLIGIVAVKTAIMAKVAALATVQAATVAWATVTNGVTAAIGIAKGVMAAFNAVLFANPIGLVIAGIAALIAAGIALYKNWDTVKQWFMSFFDWILGKFEKVAKIAGMISGAVKGIFSGNANVSLTPSPQAAAAITGGSQSVSQQTQIIVQGAGTPEATARAVAGQQNRVNADMTRNLKGATR